MTYRRKIYVITLIAISISVMTNAVNAASSSDSTKTAITKKFKAKTTARKSASLAGQTDIVAKVDLPMVTNIMPWQDKGASIPADPSPFLNRSALANYVSTPTDRDRIAGEVRYIPILNKPVDQK